jgi:hypothetical protein
MIDVDKAGSRDLVTRVATLELLVADLLHLVRQIAPDEVNILAAEAARDLELQTARVMPCGAENQRFRLHQVLDGRARNLAKRRFSSRLSVQRCAPSD